MTARAIRRFEVLGFGPEAISPSSTVGQTAFAVLRRQFVAFVARQPGTRLGDDPDELHAMRVASRRLRAAMSFFADVLPRRARFLRSELGWVADALGEVRDLDVQAERFAAWAARDPRLSAASPEPGRREDARKRLLETLDSSRYRRFVRAFGSMLRAGPSARNRAASTLVVDAAPELLRKRRRKFRKAAERLTADSPAAQYHETRIRGKRLRYALEVLEDVYGAPARDLARRVADVQDVLGRHQDAVVALARVDAALQRDEPVPPAAAFAMGVVHERCAQEASRLREAFPDVYAKTKGLAWKRLRRAMRRARPADPAAGKRPKTRIGARAAASVAPPA